MVPIGQFMHRKIKVNDCLDSSVSLHDKGVGSAGAVVYTIFVAALSLEIRLACRHEQKRIQT